MKPIRTAEVATGNTRGDFQAALIRIINRYQDNLNLDVEVQYQFAPTSEVSGPRHMALVIGRESHND